MRIEVPFGLESVLHSLPTGCLPVCLQVGLIQSDMKPDARRDAYLCDVTYVTNSELGFDYLRDNLATVSKRWNGYDRREV